MARRKSVSERLAIQHQGVTAIAELALTTAPIDDVIRQVLQLLGRAVAYRTAAFYWWDEGRRSLRRAAVDAIDRASEDMAPLEVVDSAHLLTRAVANRAPTLEPDGSQIGVPVLVKDTLIGAFGIWRNGTALGEVELAYVTQFTRQASLAIENARLLRQLRQSEEQYRSLFDACLDVVYISTPGGLFLDVNPAGMALFGFASHEDLLLADIHDLYSNPADRDDFKYRMATDGFVRDLEVQLKRSNGQVLTVLETATAMRDESGTVVAYRGILRDVSEQKRVRDALAHQALHDGLSGLPNRILLQDRLQLAIKAATRTQTTAALLLMDLDRFKEVNDTLGHATGDLLLVEVARRLRSALRPGDTVARLGGDEFAVVLPDANGLGALAAARRIIAAVEQPLALPGHGLDIDVRASAGIALFPDHGTEPDQLLQRADVAMYVSKRSASGPALYSPELDQHSPSRLALVGELRSALEQERLELHYQPQVSLADGSLVGVEGLVRWPHALHGMLGPDEFVALAEQTGMIRRLTDWVIDTALRQCQAWLRKGHRVPVAVNLSMRDLQHAHLADTIVRLVSRYGVEPTLLKLEITESVLMADPRHVIDVLRRLRATGVKVAIDDFGTGYSSLAYLADLPVDTLKIDRSFVSGLLAGKRRAAIVQSTIELAHVLGLRVVAEGVEDQATWHALAELGCDAAQGYYIARPLPASDIEDWFVESRAAA